MLAPYLSAGRLTLLTSHRATGCDVDGDRVRAVSLSNLRTGAVMVVEAKLCDRRDGSRGVAATERNRVCQPASNHDG
jgi:hypothetical protein